MPPRAARALRCRNLVVVLMLVASCWPLAAGSGYSFLGGLWLCTPVVAVAIAVTVAVWVTAVVIAITIVVAIAVDIVVCVAAVHVVVTVAVVVAVMLLLLILKLLVVLRSLLPLLLLMLLLMLPAAWLVLPASCCLLLVFRGRHCRGPLAAFHPFAC